MDDLDRLLKQHGLTDKQKRFVNAMLENPTSATRAALAAGYSPASAKTLASRLLRHEGIQSILKKHFVDRQGEVSELLNTALLRLKEYLNPEVEVADKDRIKAIKQVLDYTRVASGILGLDVKGRPKPFDLPELNPDELIRIHQSEIDRLQALRNARRPEEPEGETREGSVQH